MTDDMVSVILDVHELQEPYTVLYALEEHENVEDVEFEALEAGDIDIQGIGIERKDLSDYASSMMEGRLDEQVEKLSQRYQESYILVEGDMDETTNLYHTSISGESIRGSMASITARDNGVNAVIPVSNGDMLADVSVRLARKHFDEKPNRRFLTNDVDLSEPTSMKMFACIDGVGPEIAERIYGRYPSICEFVADGDVDSLCDIDGIGEKLAEEIVRSVHYEQ